MPAVRKEQILKGYCAVVGTYARPDGEPVALASVLVEPLKVEPLHEGRVQSLASFNVQTDEAGQLSLQLAPGRYRIVFGREHKFIINVPADKQTAVINDLVERGNS